MKRLTTALCCVALCGAAVYGDDVADFMSLDLAETERMVQALERAATAEVADTLVALSKYADHERAGVEFVSAQGAKALERLNEDELYVKPMRELKLRALNAVTALQRVAQHRRELQPVLDELRAMGMQNLAYQLMALHIQALEGVAQALEQAPSAPGRDTLAAVVRYTEAMADVARMREQLSAGDRKELGDSAEYFNCLNAMSKRIDKAWARLVPAMREASGERKAELQCVVGSLMNHGMLEGLNDAEMLSCLLNWMHYGYCRLNDVLDAVSADNAAESLAALEAWIGWADLNLIAWDRLPSAVTEALMQSFSSEELASALFNHSEDPAMPRVPALLIGEIMREMFEHLERAMERLEHVEATPEQRECLNKIKLLILNKLVPLIHAVFRAASSVPVAQTEVSRRMAVTTQRGQGLRSSLSAAQVLAPKVAVKAARRESARSGARLMAA